MDGQQSSDIGVSKVSHIKYQICVLSHNGTDQCEKGCTEWHTNFVGTVILLTGYVWGYFSYLITPH